jgi:hypothetical protein
MGWMANIVKLGHVLADMIVATVCSFNNSETLKWDMQEASG